MKNVRHHITPGTKRQIAWIAAILTAIRLTATAQDEAQPSEIRRAVRAMEEGVPQVAVWRLREILNGNLSTEDRQNITAKLGEALLAANEPDQALKVLRDPILPAQPLTQFHCAQALAALNRWAEALPIYQQIASDSASPLRAKALFGQAETLRALRRVNEALPIFQSLFSYSDWKNRAELRAVELLLDKGETTDAHGILDRTKPTAPAQKKEKRFLQARLELQLNHFNRAIELLETILRRPTGATRAVLIATLCAKADCHLRSNTPDAGDDALEDFIEHHPRDPELPTIFKKLDELYQAEHASSDQELRRWINDALQPRRALAQWYLARAELRAGHSENARRIFDDLRQDNLQLPILAGAFLELAQLKIDDRKFDEALAILQEARNLRPEASLLAKISLLTGRTQYEARNFETAAKTFEELAQTAPRLTTVALQNASLAWLQANDRTRFQIDYQGLSEAGGSEDARGDLALEEGLTQAAQGNKKAEETLLAFLRSFPKHKRASEAWVALAELAFHSTPAKLDAARKYLASARETGLTGNAAERADYILIWVEDASPRANSQKIVDLAREFLAKHSNSSLIADVRLKLAEIYYRQQDFPNAQTQFQILVQENPKAPLAEKATFFAAKSAMQSMGTQAPDRALLMLDEVVKRNGDLKWAARNEQALIERKLGKTHDAITLYDEVLQGNAKPEEKREALCGKGDILYELGPTDKENYRRAIQIFDQLAAQKEEPHWHNQALFKKGVCLEKLGDRNEALGTFYEVIADENQPERAREFFWYYKAGFNAGRLLEDDARWEPAASVYQRLASAGGTRSDEAKSRLNRLRLEHFLWDQ